MFLKILLLSILSLIPSFVSCNNRGSSKEVVRQALYYHDSNIDAEVNIGFAFAGNDEIVGLTQQLLERMLEKTKAVNDNKIIEVGENYVLKENIIVPLNSTLNFYGGSISGAYTIKGQYTCITGDVRFSPEVKFNGTFNNIQTVYVDWFVNEYRANTDCSAGIRSAIALAKLSRTSLSFGAGVSTSAVKYYCTSGDFDVSDLVIIGNGATLNGVGDYNMFVVDGSCSIRDLNISKYPYQDGSSDKDYENAAIVCKNNHQIKFDNVVIDGFHYGFLLDRAWNLNLSGCTTRRCSIGIESRGLSVNNNIANCRITGSICGIEVNGTSEGWMISDNLIVGATGIRLKNQANTIIKGNIVDLCTDYAMEIKNNCPGLLIDNNYMAIEKGGEAIISIDGQQIKNNEDQMISITNNILRGYKPIKGNAGISVLSGKYKHIKIIGNHIKADGLKYGISVGSHVSINTLYVRDNFVEGKVNEPVVSVEGRVNNLFETDNVKIRL